jgi:hypothetical protein
MNPLAQAVSNAESRNGSISRIKHPTTVNNSLKAQLKANQLKKGGERKNLNGSLNFEHLHYNSYDFNAYKNMNLRRSSVENSLRSDRSILSRAELSSKKLTKLKSKKSLHIKKFKHLNKKLERSSNVSQITIACSRK